MAGRRHAQLFGVVLGVALFSGCSSGTPVAVESTVSATTASADMTGQPTSSVGETTDAAAVFTVDEAALQEMVSSTAKAYLIPGVIAVLHTPQGEITLTYGTTEIGKQTPPTPDTHFRIASNTKTMTAAVIVLLAQEGKLTFDDPVSMYVPNVPNGDTITVSDLLKMRTGLYNFTNSPQVATSLDNTPDRVWTMEEVLAVAFSEPPNFEPDADFEYSNTNYALLGLIAEKLDNKPLPQIFQDRLYGPLGMKNTVFPEPESAGTIAEPYSHGYLYGGASYALLDGPYPADIVSAAHAGTLQPNDDTHQNSSYAKGAGGANSTAADLMTWMTALVDGELFDTEFHQQWLDSPQVQNPDNLAGQWYGYGIVRQEIDGQSVYYHGGELPGFNSFMGRDPVNDMTLVVWTNLPVEVDQGRQTANDIAVKIMLSIYGQ